METISVREPAIPELKSLSRTPLAECYQCGKCPVDRQKETCIAREEGGVALAPQKNDDLLVLQPLVADIHSNLPHRDPRRFQQQALPIEDVLVENDQAGARSSTYSVAAYWAE
jgi:hypothetical protein